MMVDAELLARLVRADRLLLSPVKHRGEEAQADLMGVRVRAQLVELRTQTVNAVRGLVKPFGQRLASCDADSLNTQGIYASRRLAGSGLDPQSRKEWARHGSTSYLWK